MGDFVWEHLNDWESFNRDFTVFGVKDGKDRTGYLEALFAGQKCGKFFFQHFAKLF